MNCFLGLWFAAIIFVALDTIRIDLTGDVPRWRKELQDWIDSHIR